MAAEKPRRSSEFHDAIRRGGEKPPVENVVSPYRLDELPTGDGAGRLVSARFSGVSYIGIQHEWPWWQTVLGRIAEAHGVNIGIEAWLNPNGGAIMEGDRATVLCKLYVADPSLPEPHREKFYAGVGAQPQEAIWDALYDAGLVARSSRN